MEGRYLGYDGPCPPWNDERVHRYHFEVLALGIAHCGLKAGSSLAELRAAIAGHVLARAALVGRYSLNPAIRLRRSEEHTSELQSLMRISYAVFCLKKKKK